MRLPRAVLSSHAEVLTAAIVNWALGSPVAVLAAPAARASGGSRAAER